MKNKNEGLYEPLSNESKKSEDEYIDHFVEKEIALLKTRKRPTAPMHDAIRHL